MSQIEALIQCAVKLQNDRDYFKRNAHMFQGFSLTPEPDYFQVAAVLTAFLNEASKLWGIDLGMYMSDFVDKGH